jgi:hypothetical protein
MTRTFPVTADPVETSGATNPGEGPSGAFAPSLDPNIDLNEFPDELQPASAMTNTAPIAEADPICLLGIIDCCVGCLSANARSCRRRLEW